jgi:hypothetical protein
VHAHARAVSPGHVDARAHTQIYNTYSFSTASVFRGRVTVLLYTYIACLVSTVFDECRIYDQHLVLYNGRGKFRPRTGREGPEGEQSYSSTISLTLELDGLGI